MKEKGKKKAKTESIRVKYLHGDGELMIKGCGRVNIRIMREGDILPFWRVIKGDM